MNRTTTTGILSEGVIKTLNDPLSDDTPADTFESSSSFRQASALVIHAGLSCWEPPISEFAAAVSKFRRFLAHGVSSIPYTGNHRILDASQHRIYVLKERLKEELFGFCDLPYDWDGDDGHAPAYEDVANAYEFITYVVRCVSENALHSVEPMVAGDGDVGFEWDTEKGEIEVGFRRGNISFYGETAANEIFKGGEKFTKDRIPEKLNMLMSHIFAS